MCALHHAHKHGHKTREGMSPTYVSWNSMMARCNRPSSPSFKNYGAKGIAVCDRWHNFISFLEDMGERPNGTSLDRIDGSLGYEPGNCRWATRTEQNRNRSGCRKIEFRGESLTLSEWAERSGVKENTLSRRLYGFRWPVDKVLKEIV